MPERTVEQIAAAQLEYDVAEAKVRASDWLGSNFVDAIENLIGKVVMRWWFARIVKNKAAHSQVDPEEIEGRRRVRAQQYIACCTTINEKTKAMTAALRKSGADAEAIKNAPDNLQLQLAMMDLTAGQTAIWQALADAAIISPDGKQQYLDDAAGELYNRIVAYAARIDTATRGPSRAQ